MKCIFGMREAFLRVHFDVEVYNVDLGFVEMDFTRELFMDKLDNRSIHTIIRGIRYFLLDL
jgi:hypothetical protein